MKKAIRFFSIVMLVLVFVSSFLVVSDFDMIIVKTEKGHSTGGFFHSSNGAILPQEINNSNEYYSTFSRLYFSNLYQNMVYNDYNMCGITGLGMFLSYYDTFMDDNMISEIYDEPVTINNLNAIDYTNSPGIKEQRFTTENLKYYIKNEPNSFLSTKLAKIGIDMGYFLDNQQNIDFGYTRFYYIYDVLMKYLESDSRISKYRFSLEYENHEFDFKDIMPNSGNITYSQYMRNKIINHIKNGIPVLVGMSQENSEQEGHILIAYDYNATTDTIYGNFGWRSNTRSYENTHKDIESERYNNISDYIALIPSNSHNHSNNLIYNKEGKCSCKLSNHEHVMISYDLIPFNKTHHYANCYCGASILEEHYFRLQGKNLVCNNCLFSKPNDGGFYPIIHGDALVELLSA